MLPREICDRRTEILSWPNGSELRMSGCLGRGLAAQRPTVAMWTSWYTCARDAVYWTCSGSKPLWRPCSVVRLTWCPNVDYPRRFTKKFSGSAFRYDRATPGLSGPDSPEH